MTAAKKVLPENDPQTGLFWCTLTLFCVFRAAAEGNISSRHHGRNRMLIDHLLFTIYFHQNNKAVESFDIAFELESIDQKHRHSDIFLTHLIQKRILQIELF